MTRLFRSKSNGLVGISELNAPPPNPYLHSNSEDEEEDDEDEYESYEDEIDSKCYGEVRSKNNPISTPFITPSNGGKQGRHSHGNQFPVLDFLAAALRKSLVTCSVETDEISSLDISSPKNVRHISHVTFDRFNGFLGLPRELEPEVPRRVPSASVSVFGVSAKSMQCAFDDRGNSVPTILVMMQKRLYSGGGLKAEGIFRINAENSQEQFVRDQLNKGIVPRGIDVHCLAGLIKAWLRELPTGVLDSLTPEQVMQCNTEDNCSQLVKLLPPTEAALLDWVVNLMADVVQFEQFNKMNARNIAMVFAPNMTQMADPLTALIHAVQVMNFLKTLILKTLREREESDANITLFASSFDSPNHKTNNLSSNSNKAESFDQTSDVCAHEGAAPTNDKSKPASLDRRESDSETDEKSVSVSGRSTPRYETKTQENSGREGDDSTGGDWLSLRKGVRKLCRHPVFQLSKPAKKTRSFGDVSSRGRDSADW